MLQIWLLNCRLNLVFALNLVDIFVFSRLHIADLDCHVADLASEFEFDRKNTLDWSRTWFVNVSAGKTLLVCLTGQITLVPLT